MAEQENIALQSEQMNRVRLENEKMELEIKELQREKRDDQHILRLVPMISVILACAGFITTIYQYTEQQAANRTAEDKRTNTEEKTAQRDAMKPWVENQREIYRQALAAAATLASTEDSTARKAAKDTFFRLYHGEMILVETKEVADAMIDFGACFEGEVCDPEERKTRCHILGTSMAKSMAETAQKTYDIYQKSQYQYAKEKQQEQQELSHRQPVRESP